MSLAIFFYFLYYDVGWLFLVRMVEMFLFPLRSDWGPWWNAGLAETDKAVGSPVLAALPLAVTNASAPPQASKGEFSK